MLLELNQFKSLYDVKKIEIENKLDTNKKEIKNKENEKRKLVKKIKMKNLEKK